MSDHSSIAYYCSNHWSLCIQKLHRAGNTMLALCIEPLRLEGRFSPCCKYVTQKHISIHLQPCNIAGNCEQHSNKTAKGPLPPTHVGSQLAVLMAEDPLGPLLIHQVVPATWRYPRRSKGCGECCSNFQKSLPKKPSRNPALLGSA